MKRYFKLSFLFLLAIPVIIHANETYRESVSRANNYLNSGGTSSSFNFSDKDKYLVYGSGTKYEFSNGSSRENSSFFNGGLLNEEEFVLSRKKGATYLLTGAPYWTMTGNNNYRKYIGVYNLETEYNYNDTSHDTRVTQLVKPNTKVSGSGKFSDPWVFETGYSVIVRTNNKNRGVFRFNNATTEKVETIVKSGSSFELEMIITDGYKYVGGDECNFKKPASNSNKYKIMSVTRDLDCVTYFNERVFKFTLKSSKGYTKDPIPKTIYYKFNDGWYTDYNSDEDKVNNKITKISKPELT